MTDQLSELLRGGVPEPPALDGLAESATRRAVARRGRRRLAITGAAALAVVVAVLTPTLIDRTTDAGTPTGPAATVAPPPQSTDGPEDASGIGECRADVTHDSFPDSPGVSVRFCEVGALNAASASAIVPDVVLTDAAAELADGLSNRLDGHCASIREPNPFRIQVTFADGSATEIDQRDGGCGNAYAMVMQAVADQETADLPPAGDVDLACPSRMPRGSRAPSLRLDTHTPTGDPLASLPVRDAAACVYNADDNVNQRSLTAEQGERIRLGTLSGISSDNIDCAATEDPLVRILLFLADASTHVIEIQTLTCPVIWVDGGYLGVADAQLSDLLDRLLR